MKPLFQIMIISDGIIVPDKDNLRCWCLLICNASCLPHVKHAQSGICYTSQHQHYSQNYQLTSGRSRISQRWGANLLFSQNLPKTERKWRKLDREGGVRQKFYYVDQPLLTAMSNGRQSLTPHKQSVSSRIIYLLQPWSRTHLQVVYSRSHQIA